MTQSSFTEIYMAEKLPETTERNLEWNQSRLRLGHLKFFTTNGHDVYQVDPM